MRDALAECSDAERGDYARMWGITNLIRLREGRWPPLLTCPVIDVRHPAGAVMFVVEHNGETTGYALTPNGRVAELSAIVRLYEPDGTLHAALAGPEDARDLAALVDPKLAAWAALN